MGQDTEKYEKLLKEYEQFAYIVSHDLRAPIRQIKGFTDLFVKSLGEDLTEQQETYKEMIDHVISDADKTLDALLEYSRIATSEKCFEELDLNEVVSQALEELKDNLGHSEFDITVEDMPEVYGDPDLLKSLFVYALDNAVKFQPPGQRPRIKVFMEGRDGENVFTISDNGIGIDPKFAEGAFTIFRTLNARALYEGGGAGLACAKKIVDVHEGEIWIDSALEEGVRLSFTLGLQH